VQHCVSQHASDELKTLQDIYLFVQQTKRQRQQSFSNKYSSNNFNIIIILIIVSPNTVQHGATFMWAVIVSA